MHKQKSTKSRSSFALEQVLHLSEFLNTKNTGKQRQKKNCRKATDDRNTGKLLCLNPFSFGSSWFGFVRCSGHMVRYRL